MAVGAGPREGRLSCGVDQQGKNLFALPAANLLAFHALLHGFMVYGWYKKW